MIAFLAAFASIFGGLFFGGVARAVSGSDEVGALVSIVALVGFATAAIQLV